MLVTRNDVRMQRFKTGVSFYQAEGYVGLEAMAKSILSIRRGPPSSEFDQSLYHSPTTSHPPANKQPFYPRSP
jgi:fermentation-respiration switch protein FrsA (DUF1100 family)